MSFNTLPSELFGNIFKFLSDKELVVISAVNKQFYSIAISDFLWKPRSETLLPFFSIGGLPYKDVYVIALEQTHKGHGLKFQNKVSAILNKVRLLHDPAKQLATEIRLFW